MDDTTLQQRRGLWLAMGQLFRAGEVRWRIPLVARACAEAECDEALLSRAFCECLAIGLDRLHEDDPPELDEAQLIAFAEGRTLVRFRLGAGYWACERAWRACLKLTRTLKPLSPGERMPRASGWKVLAQRYFEPAACDEAALLALGRTREPQWATLRAVLASTLSVSEQATRRDRERRVEELLACVHPRVHA